MPADRRRRPSTVVIVCASALLAAVVALAIVLPITLGGSDQPDSQRSVAQAWGRAALFHDRGTLARLSCTSKSNGLGVYQLIFEGSGVTAGPATSTGPASWSVEITTVGPGGGTSITVDVERKGGRYLVC